MLRRLTSSSSVEPVLVETVLEIRPEERALHESVLANLRELSPELADVTSTTASTTDRNSPSSEFSKHVSDAKDKSASTKQVTPETLTRFLRARNQNPAAAAKMLAGSLVLPPTPIHSLRCVEDPKAHSFYPIGPSIRGEPVAYSNYQVTNINPTDNVTHMRFAMDHLFREDGLERMIWVMDMHAFSRKHMNPSVARKVLSLFADNYPERLGRAVIYDAPSIFYSLFSAVKLFADPVTVAKAVFVKHDKNTRRASLEAVGIQGECLDRLLKEIDDIRDPDIAETKNWWTVSPMPPLVDYGKLITDASNH